MQLQNFVTEVIEELGGIVEPVEYALCNVLIPEEYKGRFQNRTELILAFDFEVAQENPGSDFVTFGSYVLEEVLAIVNEKALSATRFAEVDRLLLGEPLKKLGALFHGENKRLTILEEKPVMGVWAVFQFLIAYLTDEKEVHPEQVWVNLLTGEISESMKQHQNRIVCQDEPLYSYPVPGEIKLSEGVKAAWRYANDKAEQQNQLNTQDWQMQKDLDRIGFYYQDLLDEQLKKASRKGISENKKNELLDKAKAIEVEREKQIRETMNKYKGSVNISLDNGILYIIPLLEYRVEIQKRNEKAERLCYYNPITKLFELPEVQNCD